MALALYLFWAVTWLAWVLLALAPTTAAASPEWLLLTREVCFGSLPDTLPSAQGWVSLAAPIPMLVALLAISGGDLKRQARGLSRPLQLLLVLLPVVTVGYMGLRVVQERPALEARGGLPPLSPDYPILELESPDFQLSDQDGRTFQKADFQGEVTVLTFAYAHCETVCPRLLSTMRELQGVRKVVVTLDPWRDTCGSLSSIANLWELGSTRVLSGDPEQVARLTDAFSVPVTRDEKTGEIFHPALVFILDREAKVTYGFTDPPLDWIQEGVKRSRLR